MFTVLAQALVTFAAIGAVGFFMYWMGAADEQRRSRRYAREAYGNARIAQILAEANKELKAELNALESGRALTVAEARAFERVIREAGL